MDLSEEAADDVTIVAIAGRLDTQTASRLSERLTALPGSGQWHLLFEAARVNYIGGAGFRALLLAAKRASAMGGSLAVCSTTGPVARVIEIAGLHEVFEVYPSREAALARLTAA